MDRICRGKCFRENKHRCQYRRLYQLLTFDTKIPKACGVCEYSLITDQLKCYCCNAKYRTKPLGHTRKETLEVMGIVRI